MSTCIRQTSASHPKFAFSPTFIFYSPICPNNCGVVFLRKYILVFEKWFFFRSTAQIYKFSPWILPELCDPLSILKLEKKHLIFWWIIFVRHTFSMSKSSIKTKTVLTMTDMTESTELQAFKRQKDGYKVTVKISLSIFVVLSWDELKVRKNLLASDYKIYMVCLLLATVNWHKSLQFVKKI